MSVQTSSRHGTPPPASGPAGARNRTAAARCSPAWISVGGKPRKSPNSGGQHGGGQLLVPGIGPTHRPDIVQGDGGVQLRPLCIGLPTGRHIRPWGHEDQPGRQPPALLLQPVAQHQRQVSSRRVPRHRHVPGPVALAHQMVPRLHRIVHRRREGVLGASRYSKERVSQPVTPDSLGGQRPGVAQISAGIAPAVAVQDGVVPVIAPLRPHPGRVHPLQLKGGPLHPDHGGDEPAQHLLSRPLPLQVLRAHGLGRAGRVDCLQGPSSWGPGGAPPPPPAGRGVGWVTRTRLPLSFSVIVLTFLFWDLDHDKPTTSGRVWQWPLPPPCLRCREKLRRSDKIARAGAHALRRAWRYGMMDLI